MLAHQRLPHPAELPADPLEDHPSCHARMAAPRPPQLLPLPKVGKSYRVRGYPYTVKVHRITEGTVWCFLQDGRPNPSAFPISLKLFFEVT